jgi:Acetoacetate decarboxylase (ADC)
VIWESDAAPIILGRERGGYAKIFGSIPDSVDTQDGSTFECREYETMLLRAEVTGWQPIEGEELTSLQQAASSSASLGWKYIPGVGPEPDADYPVRLVGHYSYDAAWRGRGTVAFERPGATAAPVLVPRPSRARRAPSLGLRTGDHGSRLHEAPSHWCPQTQLASLDRVRQIETRWIIHVPQHVLEDLDHGVLGHEAVFAGLRCGLDDDPHDRALLAGGLRAAHVESVAVRCQHLRCRSEPLPNLFDVHYLAVLSRGLRPAI